MSRKQAEVINIKQVEEQMNEQVKTIKGSYMNMLTVWRMMFNESMKALDNQMEYMLAMQLGYLDFIKMMTRIHPDIKEMNTNMFPFLGQMEYLDTLHKDVIEIKKRKTEKLSKTFKNYHKQAADNTLEAFDKYCDLLSAV